MRKALTIVVVIGIIAVAALWLIRSTPSNPIAVIEVMDTAGKPVVGAIIKPDGLRPKKINGHYGWTDDNAVKPTPVKTDKQGIARVPYPRYVQEKQETGEISFSVEHPDYCSDRPFRSVSITPPANAKLQDKLNFLTRFLTGRIVIRPDPVVLKRGGIIKVSGYMDGKKITSPHMHPQLASMLVPRAGYWVSNASGEFINQRVPEGSNALRLVYLPPDGRACFSDLEGFTSVPGRTNEFRLELKPGFRVSGSLDTNVPRPVMNGHVQISLASTVDSTAVGSKASWGTKASWRAWTKIMADGTFKFDSLPAGHLDVAAICDGFKSKDGPGKLSKIFCMPQVFEITNSDLNITVAMEPNATLEVNVLDDAGKALSNATVALWPNIAWRGQGGGIFMGWTFQFSRRI